MIHCSYCRFRAVHTYKTGKQGTQTEKNCKARKVTTILLLLACNFVRLFVALPDSLLFYIVEKTKSAEDGGLAVLISSSQALGGAKYVVHFFEGKSCKMENVINI